MKRLTGVTPQKGKQLSERIVLAGWLAFIQGSVIWASNLDRQNPAAGERLMESTPWISPDMAMSLASTPILAYIIGGCILILTMLISHNVICKGKSGWGWFAVGVMAAMFVLLGKVALSMFLEVSSDDAIPRDWDD